MKTCVSKMRRLALLGAALLAACGGDDDNAGDDGATPDASVSVPDAASPADAGPPDAAPTSCLEFTTPAATLTTFPATFAGDLAKGGADVNIDDAVTCAAADAPFGQAGLGPDQVVALTGLTAGMTYNAKVFSAGDLAVYVVDGCTGMALGGCLSFTDAAQDGLEVAPFVAPASGTAYVIVDYYSDDGQLDPTIYDLRVDQERCEAPADCPGATPVCDALAFCTRRDTCVGDDTTAEAQSDDGPSGATPIGLGNAPVVVTANVCNDGSGEQDWYKVTLPAGGAFTVEASWADMMADLDLYVLDATLEPVGFSFWQNPETVAVNYLAAGTYYVYVERFTPGDSTAVTPYTLTFTQDATKLCTADADCDDLFAKQIFRGDCNAAGACVPIDGQGAVALGGHCDSTDDCVADADLCTSFRFTEKLAERALCSKTCTGDTDCTTVGAGAKCSTGGATNVCTLPCTADNQCPSRITQTPPMGSPWKYFTCTVATGACNVSTTAM